MRTEANGVHQAPAPPSSREKKGRLWKATTEAWGNAPRTAASCLRDMSSSGLSWLAAARIKVRPNEKSQERRPSPSLETKTGKKTLFGACATVLGKGRCVSLDPFVILTAFFCNHFYQNSRRTHFVSAGGDVP